MGLAVVRDLRDEARAPAGPEELADFETDVLAGVRAGAGGGGAGRWHDPLHLAGIFGLDDKTAIRYANAARHLLESAAEQYAATGSARTQGSNPRS